jgi:hypothetical protein
MSGNNIVINFLNELKSDNSKTLFDVLNLVLEQLENKNDPEPIEIEVVDLAYQAIEKFQLLEAAMRKYVTDYNESLTGNILDDLYDRKITLFD